MSVPYRKTWAPRTAGIICAFLSAKFALSIFFVSILQPGALLFIWGFGTLSGMMLCLSVWAFAVIDRRNEANLYEALGDETLNGSQLSRAYADKSGLQVSAGTLYTAMRRLAMKGVVISWDVEEDRRKVRYFRRANGAAGSVHTA